VSSDCLSLGHLHFFCELSADSADFFLRQYPNRRNGDAVTRVLSLKRVGRCDREFVLVVEQIFNRWRHRVVLLLLNCLKFGDTCGEENALELLEVCLRGLLALRVKLLNLLFFYSVPFSKLAIFVLLEACIELTKQTLRRSRCERALQLLDGVIVRALLVGTEEFEDLIASHAEAFIQDRLQVLVEGLHFLDITLFQRDSQTVIELVDLGVEHLLDLVFVSLGGALAHLCQELVLAVLGECAQLALQVCLVVRHLRAPVGVLHDEGASLARVALHALVNQLLQDSIQVVRHILKRLGLQLLDLSAHLVVGVLAEQLQLGVKAVVEL